MKKKVFLSESPVRKSKVSGRYFKTLTDKDGHGGKIVANIYGDTEDEAIRRAFLYEKAINLFLETK